VTTRSETNTTRVETPMGTLYVHVNHIGGAVSGLSISQHGKHTDTTVSKTLDLIRDAFNRDIEDINRRYAQ
jgi:hypothetical protein